MVDKIKANIEKVVIVLSCVAISFLVFYGARFLDMDIDNIDWVQLSGYALLLAASIVFLVFGLKKKLSYNEISIPALLFLFGQAVLNFNTFYNNQKFANIPGLLLVVAIIVLWFIYMTNKNVKNALLILLLIFGILNFIYAINANTINVAILALTLCIALPILEKEGE